MARNERPQVDAAISKHLATHGPENWELLFQQFPETPVRTLRRWIADVKAAPARREQVEAARARVESLSAGAKAQTELVMAQMPVPLDYVLKSGAAGLRKLNILGMMDDVERDIELLRQYSLTTDGARIRMPKFFSDAMRIRVNLAQLWINIASEVWSIERAQQFFKLIVDEIRAESPDCARRITQRLKTIGNSIEGDG